MDCIKSLVYVLDSPFDLHLKEESIGITKLQPHEYVAETLFSAVSPGTEVGAFLGYPPLRPGKIYPRFLGYCNVSKVICSGGGELKENEHILTFQPHRTAFKSSIKDFFIKLEPESDFKAVTTAYLFHLGYHSLITSEYKAGHNIGVIGAGVLGVTSCLISLLQGNNTFVFSNQDKIKKLVAAKGAICFDKNLDGEEKILDFNRGGGLDIIINTSNKWADWLLALKIIHKNGCIVNLGFPGRGEPLPDFNPFDPQYAYTKNLTIKALGYINESRVPPQDFRFNIYRNLEYIIDKIKTGKLNANMIITDEIDYTQLISQYKRYANRSENLLTTILHWK